MSRSSVTIEGLEDVRKVLENIAPRHAANIARSAVHGVASDIAKTSKTKVPRDKGVLKRAIKAKRRRSPSYRPRSDVIVTHGHGTKNDAWYWYFVEFGTVEQSEQPYLTPTFNYYRVNINSIFAKRFAVSLIKKLARENKKR